MRGNFFGKMLSIATFGESHGPALGVVIDGIPAGLSFCEESLQQFLDRRAPGQVGTSKRAEKDRPIILSGIYQNKTLGTPIAIIVENHDQRSKDYSSMKDVCRPGHADQTTLDKFGIRDHRGGGRASGRETVGRVIAGYFASLILPGLKLESKISKIAGLEDVKNWKNYLEELSKRGESAGAQATLTVSNIPAGLGEPVFDKLKSDLGKALLSIGGCCSFSFGAGEDFSNLVGSQVKREHFGGIEGGISNGEDISLTVTFKPPSTIGKSAKEGRHDPCILPRALPVMESMVRLVIVDHYIRQFGYENKRN